MSQFSTSSADTQPKNKCWAALRKVLCVYNVTLQTSKCIILGNSSEPNNTDGFLMIFSHPSTPSIRLELFRPEELIIPTSSRSRRHCTTSNAAQQCKRLSCRFSFETQQTQSNRRRRVVMQRNTISCRCQSIDKKNRNLNSGKDQASTSLAGRHFICLETPQYGVGAWC